MIRTTPESRYLEKYARLNPAVVPAIMYVKPGEVCSLSTVMKWDQFLHTRFYKEWAQPQGYADTTNVLIEKSATSIGHLATAYLLPDSPADDETRWRMRLIAAHVCRAVAISKIIDLSRIEAAMLADAVDGVAAGVFLVRANGEIAHANTSAQAMLRESNVLREIGGVIRVFDSTAQKTLGEAFGAAEGGDIALGRRGTAVPLLSRDGERYVAHVLSLTSGLRRRTGRGYAAVAAVFVHKAALKRPTLIEVVAEHD